MTEWITTLDELATAGQPSVLLTVGKVRGSAPRETGAKMIVTASESIGTIGGGQLEYQCVQIACEQLRSEAPPDKPVRTRRFALGAGCGQCCGGVVDVMFEYLPESRADWLEDLSRLHFERRPAIVATSTGGGPRKWVLTAGTVDRCYPEEIVAAADEILKDGGAARMVGDYLVENISPHNFHIAVFGAGHVGAAVVDVLSRLDCGIRWVDSRRSIFPQALPANVTAVEAAEPAREVAAMPEGSYYLIMTHSHSADFDICDQVLRREDVAYCGLIGSTSKRRRFERLMKKQGMAQNHILNLVCPIGVRGIDGKKPVEIAVAVAAEVLQKRDALRSICTAPVLIEETG